MISTKVISKFLYSIGNAHIREFPFPHFLAEEVFPKDFYIELLKNLPAREIYKPITESGRIIIGEVNRQTRPSDNRLLIDLKKESIVNFPAAIQPFWTDVIAFLNSGELLNYLLQKFEPSLRERFPHLDKVGFRPDTQLIRDSSGYEISPHTDQPRKIAVLLFYFPSKPDNVHLGTSIYMPKDYNFTCEGGPHHDRELFDQIFTAPYMPNSALGFFKTNNSFHGVEPVIGEKIERNLIQYSILEN